MGTVTFQGVPAEGVTVSFVPDGGGQSAVGVTDASGKYTLTTIRQGDGAVPGKYKVGFAKYEGQQAIVTEPGDAHADYDISDEYPADYDPNAPEDRPSRNLLPMRYSDPNTSGYMAEVVEGENTHDFDLQG